MNILILGGGGREHTFAWKIRQSKACSKLFIAPGNAGTSELGTNVNLDVNNFGAVKRIVLDHDISMVVVGPEAPLVGGIVDYFLADPELSGIAVIGPEKAAARLEGSKAFAKQFMSELDIPTAKYRAFSKTDLEEGRRYLREHPLPIVLKADGLAAGKGVIICQTREEALREFDAMLQGKFGKASERVVVEEFLEGIEFSVFVLTDGRHYQILPVAKDYKRIGEGDTGPNTGGMGAVSPVSFVTKELLDRVDRNIIRPTITGLQSRSLTYKGFIFFGLISVNNQPYVIEYNCRMGDPETQVVLPRIKNDLTDLLQAVHNGTLDQMTIELSDDAAAAVILVSGGYPGPYEKGKPIEGLTAVEDSLVFHAGTRLASGKLITDGGRVLAVTTFARNYQDALAVSNKNAEVIQFPGKYFRTDIGFDL